MIVHELTVAMLRDYPSTVPLDVLNMPQALTDSVVGVGGHKLLTVL